MPRIFCVPLLLLENVLTNMVQLLSMDLHNWATLGLCVCARVCLIMAMT